MLDMFRRLELKYTEYERLFAHARARGLIPLSTPADLGAVEMLEQIATPAYKVGSDDLVYTDFLRAVARQGKPVILSTGMAGAADIERAVAAVQGEGNDQLVVLHCVSLYPTPEDKVNLRRIRTLQSMFDAPIGFSDHSAGITAALGAVALGACIVEKHFTLDRGMSGPDHRFSADPAELAALVREIRRLEDHLGNGRFALSAEEEEMARLAHRSIVFAQDLPAGTVLAKGHLAYRRPGTGLMPYEVHRLIGGRLTAAVRAGALALPDMVEPGHG
jgi:sialic acid synthase SpsE